MDKDNSETTRLGPPIFVLVITHVFPNASSQEHTTGCTQTTTLRSTRWKIP